MNFLHTLDPSVGPSILRFPAITPTCNIAASVGLFGLVFGSVIIYLCSYSIVHFKVFLTCRYFVGFELTHTYGKWNSNGISQKWYPSLCPSAQWLPFYFLLIITIFIEFTNMCLISMSEVVFIYPNCAYLFYFYLEKKILNNFLNFI